MVDKNNSIKDILKYKTRKRVLKRFFIVLSVLLIYLVISVSYYGFKDGFLVSFLTWSLFVLCTPIADAGFLLDFPIRLFTKIKMIYSEVIVWTVAISLNILVLIFNSRIYEKTFLLKIFKLILSTPIPYWFIILFSALGTFLSIYFGDELLDVIQDRHRKKYNKHKKKHSWIIILFIIVLIILVYYSLLNNLGINF